MVVWVSLLTIRLPVSCLNRSSRLNPVLALAAAWRCWYLAQPAGEVIWSAPSAKVVIWAGSAMPTVIGSVPARLGAAVPGAIGSCVELSVRPLVSRRYWKLMPPAVGLIDAA